MCQNKRLGQLNSSSCGSNELHKLKMLLHILNRLDAIEELIFEYGYEFEEEGQEEEYSPHEEYEDEGCGSRGKIAGCGW